MLTWSEFLSYFQVIVTHGAYHTSLCQMDTHSHTVIHTQTMPSLLTFLYIMWLFQTAALCREKGPQYVLGFRCIVSIALCTSLACIVIALYAYCSVSIQTLEATVAQDCRLQWMWC